MKNQTIFAVVDSVAQNVCHVFFANSEGFAKRVFEDFFKRAEVPEESKGDYVLVKTGRSFLLPETYSEFLDEMVDGSFFDGSRAIDKEKV